MFERAATLVGSLLLLMLVMYAWDAKADASWHTKTDGGGVYGFIALEKQKDPVKIVMRCDKFSEIVRYMAENTPGPFLRSAQIAVQQGRAPQSFLQFSRIAAQYVEENQLQGKPAYAEQHARLSCRPYQTSPTS